MAVCSNCCGSCVTKAPKVSRHCFVGNGDHLIHHRLNGRRGATENGMKLTRHGNSGRQPNEDLPSAQCAFRFVRRNAWTQVKQSKGKEATSSLTPQSPQSPWFVPSGRVGARRRGPRLPCPGRSGAGMLAVEKRNHGGGAGVRRGSHEGKSRGPRS